MAMHYVGYKVIAGERAACGRFFEEGGKQQTTTDLSKVTCRRCWAADSFKTAKARTRPDLERSPAPREH